MHAALAHGFAGRAAGGDIIKFSATQKASGDLMLSRRPLSHIVPTDRKTAVGITCRVSHDGDAGALSSFARDPSRCLATRCLESPSRVHLQRAIDRTPYQVRDLPWAVTQRSMRAPIRSLDVA